VRLAYDQYESLRKYDFNNLLKEKEEPQDAKSREALAYRVLTFAKQVLDKEKAKFKHMHEKERDEITQVFYFLILELLITKRMLYDAQASFWAKVKKDEG